MAIEKVIEIKVKGSAAQKDLDQLNATLEEQRSILIELERELLTIQELREKTSKTNLAAQKKLIDQENHLKAAIKDQKLSLRELNSEKRIATSESKSLNDQQGESGKIIAGLDKLTGGYASKVKKLYQGFVESAKSAKIFAQGLSGVQKALVATGIGALVVALGLVVAYWDDIKGAVTGVSSETTKAAKQQSKLTEETKKQYETSKSQDNILKQQGMSEEQILKYKKQQSLEYAKQLQAEIAVTKEIANQQAARAGVLSNIPVIGGVFKLLGISSEESVKESQEQINVLQDTLNTLENEQAGSDNRISDIRKQAALKRIQEAEQLRSDLLEIEREGEQIADELFLQARQDFFAKKAEQDEINFELYRDMEDEMFDIELQEIQEQNKKKLSEEQAYNEGVMALRMQNINNVANGFALLGQIAGKNKALQAAALIGESAAGIARIVISTQAANTADTAAAALMGPAGIPYLAAKKLSNKIGAAIGIASNIASTSKALSALNAGGSVSRGASNLDSGGSSAPTPPSFNVVGTSGTSQLADVIAGQNQKPMKAYVVASEVSTAQSLERNIVKGASL